MSDVSRFGRRTVCAAAAIALCVLSPLTALFLVVMVAVLSRSVRELDRVERNWVIGVVAVAVALRVVAVSALFLSADHARVPFAAFFGDEAYFIKRSLWLRNISLGIPVHSLDLEYAFEANGRSSVIYLLALIQALVGPAPYALHLVSILFYVTGVLWLYRVVHPRLGRAPATCGLVLLLFLPSLFAWSVSVLKESPFVLLGAASLAMAVRLGGPGSWRLRLAAAVGLLAVAGLLQTVRRDAGVFALLATLWGLTIGWAATRPRILLSMAMAAPVLCGLLLRVPEVQLQTYAAIQRVGREHWGAVVVSPGVGYELLDDRFYANVDTVSDLRLGETMRFLTRGLVSWIVVPLPWEAESRAAVAYIPEQVLWYAIAGFSLIGIPWGFRRDPTLTGLLVAHAALLAAAAAFTDGNVGTLVRHRSLALLYLGWLGGVGICDALVAVQRRLVPRPARVLECE